MVRKFTNRVMKPSEINLFGCSELQRRFTAAAQHCSGYTCRRPRFSIFDDCFLPEDEDTATCLVVPQAALCTL